MLLIRIRVEVYHWVLGGGALYEVRDMRPTLTTNVEQEKKN